MKNQERGAALKEAPRSFFHPPRGGMNVRSAVPVWPERRFYPMDLVVLGIKDASKPVSRVLSFKTAIYLVAPLPVRSSRLPGTVGPTICPSTALLRIEFTAPFRLRTVGELLPRLSTLTCKAGGISLLHLSWGHPRRALPVILALWSPDFPHAQAFALCPRLLDLLAQVF